MSLEKNKALLRRLGEAWNTRKWAVLDELVSPDFVDHNPLPGQKPGRQGFIEAETSLTNAFPDSHLVIEDLIAEGDMVVVRLTFSGTHTGESWGIKPTGKRATVGEIVICRIVRGKIVERWAQVDSLGFRQQLGLIPQLR